MTGREVSNRRDHQASNATDGNLEHPVWGRAPKACRAAIVVATN